MVPMHRTLAKEKYTLVKQHYLRALHGLAPYHSLSSHLAKLAQACIVINTSFANCSYCDQHSYVMTTLKGNYDFFNLSFIL